MTQKKSFVLYTDYKEHIDMLSKDAKANLIDHIFSYVNGEDVNPSGDERFVFSFIKSQLDRDSEKYEKIKEKRVLAGKTGGLAKASKSKQVLANASKRKQTVANLAVTVTDTVTDTVNVNDNVKKEKSTKKENQFDDFYSRYPVKKSKKAASAAWLKMKADEKLAAMERVNSDEFKKWCEGQYRDGQCYIPHPSTWLNQGRWEDDLSENKGKPSAFSQNVNDKDFSDWDRPEDYDDSHIPF